MVTQTHLTVTLYVRCLSCSYTKLLNRLLWYDRVNMRDAKVVTEVKLIYIELPGNL